jgi:hypothetical protein
MTVLSLESKVTEFMLMIISNSFYYFFQSDVILHATDSPARIGTSCEVPNA